MSLVNRVGTFFILLGIGLIVLFILSDMAKVPSCNLLALGAISFAAGLAMWFSNPRQAGPPPARFRIFKKNSGQKPKK